MIIKLEKDSNYLGTLEKQFTDVFTKENVKKELKDNLFTNYFTYILDNLPVAFIN